MEETFKLIGGIAKGHPNEKNLPDAVQFYRGLSEEMNSRSTAIMCGDSMQDVTIEEIQAEIPNIESTQQLVDIYVRVHNKFWLIEDDVYDYETGTEEYVKACAHVDNWKELMNQLEARVIASAENEGLLQERHENSGLISQMEPFMKKYGYRDGQGWWVKI